MRSLSFVMLTIAALATGMEALRESSGGRPSGIDYGRLSKPTKISTNAGNSRRQTVNRDN
ncbi:hypothetical protein CCR75_009137 [Bremia lactucae]|uniref:Uncharacterized protein n=1 Tax=Bremia lactucae TaxID=4779 RepID=A0A976ILZ7_BRELC|nr:hypothetical protein CCR75_009137 [Bremia lactucae]